MVVDSLADIFLVDYFQRGSGCVDERVDQGHVAINDD